MKQGVKARANSADLKARGLTLNEGLPGAQTFLPVNNKQRKTARKFPPEASMIALDIWNLGAVGETSGRDKCYFTGGGDDGRLEPPGSGPRGPRRSCHDKQAPVKAAGMAALCPELSRLSAPAAAMGRSWPWVPGAGRHQHVFLQGPRAPSSGPQGGVLRLSTHRAPGICPREGGWPGLGGRGAGV